MLTPPESPRRKNDSLKSRRLLPLLMLLVIAVGSVGLLWWSSAQPKNDLPTARLMYREGIGFMALNLQTGEQTQLHLEDPYERKPSPDGKWAAHWMDINLCCDTSLWISSRVPGVKDIQLGLHFRSTKTVSWSSDSQWVAYSSTPQGNSYYENSAWDFSVLEEIYLENIYTRETKRLTENSFTDRFPCISPDGAQIAYTSDADGANRLYIMDIATRESRLLTPDREGYKPIWSPDGRWIAFTTNCKPHEEYVCTGGDLWLIRADGTGAQSIVIGAGFVEAIWLP